MSTINNALAAEILAASGLDVTQQIEIYPLAKQMHADPRCTVTYHTCRLHIAKAIRQARHPLNVLTQIGGTRVGAGRKPGQTPHEAIAARRKTTPE